MEIQLFPLISVLRKLQLRQQRNHQQPQNQQQFLMLYLSGKVGPTGRTVLPRVALVIGPDNENVQEVFVSGQMLTKFHA